MGLIFNGNGDVIKAVDGSLTVEGLDLGGSSNVNAGIGTFSGNLTVGGVLTYEDVKNVDSVGVITARSGIDCNGNATFGANGSITSAANFILSSNKLRVTGSDTVGIECQRSSNATIQCTETTNNTDLQLRANATGGLVRTAANKPLILGTNQQERLRITAGGYVGVKRSTPLANLHTTNNELAIGANPTSAAAPNATYDGLVVDGEAASFINIRSRGNGSDSYGRLAFSDDVRSRAYIEYRHKDGGGDDTMRFATAGSERVRITSDGKFGIGVTPISIFHVRPLDETNFLVRNEGSTVVLASETNNGRDNNRAMALEASHFEFIEGGSEKLRITSGGSVRIGGSTPVGYSANANVDDIVVGGTSSHGITILTGNSSTGSLWFDSENGNRGYIQYAHNEEALILGTEGSERARITSGGSLIVGNQTTTGYKLCVSEAAHTRVEVISTSNQSAGAWFKVYNSGTLTSQSTIRTSGGSLQVYTGTTSEAERLRIDSSGRLLVNQTSNYTVYADSKLQISATDSTASFSVSRWSNNGSSPYINLGKSRGGIGSYTVVQSGDRLGQINFIGADGTDLASHAASIAAYVDGTPGSNDMPGRLSFATASDGGAAETERLRIDKEGTIRIMTANGMLKWTASSGNDPFIRSIGSGQQEIEFNTGGSERLRIKSDGETNIGTGAVNIAKFCQSGNHHQIVGQAADNVAALDVYSQHGNDGDRLSFAVSDNRTGIKSNAFVVRGNGRVGIGTDAPADDPLTLYDADNNVGMYFQGPATGNANNNGFRIGRNQTHAFIWNYVNQPLALATHGQERLTINSSGYIGINQTNPQRYLHIVGNDGATSATLGNSDTQLVIDNSGTNGGHIEFLSSNNGAGHLMFTDTDGTNRGRISYHHNGDYMRFDIAGQQSLTLYPKTVGSVTSAALGINDSSPGGESLALTVKNKAHQDSNLPVVHIERVNNTGGGSGTDEIALNVTVPRTHNNANDVYTIKSYAEHNLNTTHYAGYFEAKGSQYDAGGDGAAVYATTHKTDTNGHGYVPAIYAYGRSTYNANSNGYAVGMRIRLNAYEPNVGILIHHELTNSNWTRMIAFRKGSGANGTEVGSIKSSNNATQYNTSSDYRLKENVVDLTGAITRLKQLKPKRFNFKNDTSNTVDGFIAHEVEPVVPQAVSGTKDAVKIETVADPETGKTIMNEDGTPKTQTVIDAQEVDYSKLSTLTIAALQEALAKIETLEAKVAALESS